MACGCRAAAAHDYLRTQVSRVCFGGRDHLSRGLAGREPLSWASRSRRLQRGDAVWFVTDAAAGRDRNAVVSAYYGRAGHTRRNDLACHEAYGAHHADLLSRYGACEFSAAARLWSRFL